VKTGLRLSGRVLASVWEALGSVSCTGKQSKQNNKGAGDRLFLVALDLIQKDELNNNV
jgi:hypothetical protein